MLSRLLTLNAALAEWFRGHVVIWWLVLVLIPGGAYALAHVLLNAEATSEALVLGGIFGVVFATLTVGIQLWRER